MNRKAGLSIAVSAVIISAAILVITLIAAYVSTNILNLQMENTEFEQAQSNMILLSDYIEDVGLKRGSGGTVRFNMRSGGFGVTQGTGPLIVEAEVTFEEPSQPWKPMLVGPGALVDSPFELLTVYFRGGSLVGSYNQTLRGPVKDMPTETAWLNVSTMAGSLGYVRIVQAQGARVKLDYNRVRIIPAGTVTVGGEKYYFVEVTFINLTRGDLGGSGSMSIKVQNTGILVKSTTQASSKPVNTISMTIRLPGQSQSVSLPNPTGGEVGVVFTVTVATVEIGSL